jgi:hypothetical protein
MPWKTILVLIAVAVLAVVAYDMARYEHIVPKVLGRDHPGERDSAADTHRESPARVSA